MRILIVTGLLAKEMVKGHLSRSNVDYEICALPVPVAALLSLEYIAKMLEKKDLSKIKLVLIPGLIKGDALRIEQKIHIMTRKGPKNAADLSAVLKMLSKTELSTIIPADELIKKTTILKATRVLSSLEKESIKLRRNKSVFAIGIGKGKIFIGPKLPMRVLAEIVDASNLSEDEIKRITYNFDSSEVDIIDVGMVAGGGHPEEASRAIKVVKKCTKKAVSIDTSDPAEIKAAVKAGVDLILSINAENMHEVVVFAADVPVVVTSAGKTHRVPENSHERLRQLEENIKHARLLGFSKIIADPILNPLMTPSLMESLYAYSEFRKRDPLTPLLMGVGNVTELIDADSIGANLLLVGLAAEVEANILLTTEASVKTRGSSQEVVTAIKMAALAKQRRSSLEDLGIDMLFMKEKLWKEDPPRDYRGIKRISIDRLQNSPIDPRGSFKISLDRQRSELILIHYDHGQVIPDLIIRGTDIDRLIYSTIRNNLISKLQHAYYLGKELEKARIALKTGKSYIQDFPLHFGTD